MAWSKMIAEATDSATSGRELPSLKERMTNIALAGKVPLEELHEAEVQAFDIAVSKILDHNAISAEMEKHLLDFVQSAGLDRSELNSKGSWTKMTKGCVLGDLASGKLRPRVSVNGALPFNFQKGEIVLWVFAGCRYLAEKAHSTYVGGSHGVSFRIARGVYYRIGAFKGHSVKTTSLDPIDTGTLAITQKNLYFAGPQSSLRIPLSKVVTFLPYSNGFGLFRDRMNAKREVFLVDDPWFAHNLLAHVGSSVQEPG
jgi:hypothetical protein